MATMKKKYLSAPVRKSDKNLRVQKVTRQLMNIDSKKMQVNVPSHIHKQFKSVCSKNGIKMSDIILSCIRDYLEKNK